MTAPEILKQHTETLAGYLQSVLVDFNDAPPRLMEAIRYSLDAGGKRLRPALILETFAATNRDGADITDPLACAAAMELIHTFSLVHDDLPAMDDDDLRRGKPTNHKVFGEAMAILAGDAMMTLAFDLITQRVDDDHAIGCIQVLARAAGPCGMIGGQVLDIDGEDKQLTLDQLKDIHAKKTGALLVACASLGAICADASRDERIAVEIFARHLGLAFQIVDDILDETSTPAQLGKATQKDQARGKNTYPKLLGLDGACAEAKRQMDLALSALAPLGPRADRLITLARFVVDRQS
jgi:geranylgeranyl diphosphate synthase, type II